VEEIYQTPSSNAPKEGMDNMRVSQKTIEDLLWMAARYAHGRHTYAPGIIRDAVKEMQQSDPAWSPRMDVTMKPPKPNELGGMKLREDYLDDIFYPREL